ncbi:MAG: MBL fold metallo-hydrolase [Cytophagales bacterium]
MNLHVIDTGFFKLDGGAMFGVVPKVIWQKLNPADEDNLCKWAMRCLLVESDNRKILIDTGMGDKQSDKFFSYYKPEKTHKLVDSLSKVGVVPNEVTEVILTHLHFDHVGGAVSKDDEGNLFKTFPQATYITHEKQLDWALNPNERERASFLKENILPLLDSIEFVKKGSSLADVITFLKVDGHTEAQILPLINTGKRKVLFVADLIPSVAHLPIPYVMGYDMFPMKTMKEKNEILQQALDENWILFFEHDPLIEACNLKMTEKGIRADVTGKLSDFLN